MGIRFYCPNGHRLNVKTQLAGKRGYCPHCNVKVLIPELPPEQKLPPELLAESFAIPAELDSNVLSNGTDAKSWYVRPPSGGQYGPVDAGQLNRWIAERRVPPQSHLLKEGWREWKLAATVVDAAGFVAEEDAKDSSLIKLDTQRANGSRSPKSFRHRQRARVAALLGLVTLVLLAALIFITVGR